MYMCEKLRWLNSLNDEDIEMIPFNLFLETGYNKIIPVNIEQIIEDKLDIPIHSKNFDESEEALKEFRKGIIGKVQVVDDNIEIFYNEKYQNEHRKRFTLAHELAHCILHAKDIGIDSGLVDFYRVDEFQDKMRLFTEEEKDKKSKNEQLREVEANILAGAILIPESIVTDLFNALSSSKDVMDVIVELASVFNVSLAVMRERLQYLKLI